MILYIPENNEEKYVIQETSVPDEVGKKVLELLWRKPG